jgi:hypothetical protein
MLIKDITADKVTQSRDVISEDTVNEYADAMRDGAKFPPMEVYSDGVTNWLVDGFHRYFACIKVGIKEFEVVVHKGSKRDAQFRSFCVNKDHGLQRSTPTKRKIIYTALSDIEWEQLPDTVLNDKTGIDRRLIAKVRNEHNIKRPEVKTVTRNGKELKMNTSKIGKKEKPSSPPPPPPVTNLVEVEEITENEAISELSNLNQELHEENVKLKDKMTVLSGDEEKIDNEFLVLRSTIKALEAELNAVKSSRDQFQNKNADLIKQVTYWRKRCEKAEKAVA